MRLKKSCTFHHYPYIAAILKYFYVLFKLFKLEFESAPFPAITVCNLNPFKNHLARSVPEISDTLGAFHQAVIYSNNANNEEILERKRRNAVTGSYPFVQYEAVYSACQCGRGVDVECMGSDTVPSNIDSACICTYDRRDGTAWPCYSTSTWIEMVCPECNDIGYCNLPNTTGKDSLPCFCQMSMSYCILKSEARLRRIWEFRGQDLPPKGSQFRSDFLDHLKTLGYGNMTDQVAITTRAKEKLILKMSALPPQRRAALGYGRSELIKQCSFNNMQCNIEKEFKLYIDPEFGNCYTFNADPNKTLASSRAGPNYGLRLMMFVNASDYLPTTEATGVRITIHGQNHCPFPDTFGYSAPTGAVSSFGLSLKKVNRLENGDCFKPDTPLPLGYIYRDWNYEPEGCYRNCYQKRIINRCGCADPRFPKPSSTVQICNIKNDSTRNCLLHESVKMTKRKSCRCMHSCKQDVYTTTYSAARWPSGSVQLECDNEDCKSYYSKHAVMLEIYYEQMSYEILRESESYSIVNLVSDVGGQMGLWLGASVLTAIEIIIFLIDMLAIAIKGQLLHEDTITIDKETEQQSDIDHQYKGSGDETL
ncbi:degenerin [Dictyocaulus viviparus]|uniref:Degenerin n=1 Tax=Dictyocaulus viviparus TaxID=29172 RepID=A0A0D8X625_DICVI|nr:degenerin [Dictyocaulus viviparus]